MLRGNKRTRRRWGDPPSRELTAREKTIVTMIAEGFTTKQMADILDIAIKTVETHRTAAMKKTGAHCIALLVRYAVRVGLVIDRGPD